MMPYRGYTPTSMPRGYIAPERALLWGSVPVEQVEGHEPDPAYDVRSSEGLGRYPMRSEMLGIYRSEADRDRLPVVRPPQSVTAGAPARAGNAPSLAGAVAPALDLGSILPYLVLGGVLLFVVKR